MKKAFYLCIALILLLSHAMCVTVAYAYASMRCAAMHDFASAPASVAFFTAIPFAVAILILACAAYACRKRLQGLQKGK